MKLDGIIANIKEDYSTFYIETLSTELKDKIRIELVAICHGEKNRESTLSAHSISNTVEELLKRYPDDDRKKKGFIGELLLNMIIRNYYDYEVISPFFNKEEASSAKKGFDIILYDNSNGSVWITESKAGEVTVQNVDEKILERITVAESDLNTRLNEGNQTIWLNALNDVGLSMNESNEKLIVQTILDRGKIEPSNKFNVALGGIVFHNMGDRFNESSIINKTTKVINSSKFLKVKVISIQKETYEKVADYLRELV